MPARPPAGWHRPVVYDGYGNIRARSGVGAYAYGAGTAGPHAVTSVTKPDNTQVTYAYDANGNNTSGDGRSIAYTAFDKPKSIGNGGHGTTFAYGPNRSRFKRVDTVTEGTGASRTTRTTTTLYLGSVDLLTDAGGGIDRDMRFDAWGRRAAPATGEPLADSAAKAFDHCDTTRGFTGHEMLDEVGVVHMNGRIYDPALARFLQADPVVQFPGSVQSWNRYSYVLNNPLAYTDPTGHFIGPLATFAARTLVAHLAHRHLFSQVPLLGAVTGIYVCSQSVVACIDFAAHSAYAQTGSFSAALKAGAVQGISAAAFNAVGSGPFGYAPGDKAGQLLLNAVANGLVGGVMHELQGGRFGHGFLASGASALAKPAIHAAFGTGAAGKPYRIAARAAIGGTLSSATGGKFVNGAATAAFAQAYNAEAELDRRRPVSVRTDGNDVIIEHADGTIETRSGGTRSWRNNNPGNLRNYAFSRERGSIGEAGGFAVFASEPAGRRALIALLESPAYQRRTIDETIARYAPPIENDTNNYRALVHRITGLPGNTGLRELNVAQLNRLANAILRIEGWRTGTVTSERENR